MKIPECLKKLSPNWAKEFEESKSIDEVSKEFEIDESYFDIGDLRCCVVGEANLFSDEYFRNLVGKGCDGCVDFSYAFAHLTDHSRFVRPSEPLANLTLEELAEKFCDHMKEIHGRDLT